MTPRNIWLDPEGKLEAAAEEMAKALAPDLAGTGIRVTARRDVDGITYRFDFDLNAALDVSDVELAAANEPHWIALGRHMVRQMRQRLAEAAAGKLAEEKA